jgi:transposase
MLLLNEEQSGLSAEQQFYLAYQLTLTQEENTGLKTTIDTLKAENTSLQAEVNRLKEQLTLATHRKFGRQSEVGEPVLGDDSGCVSVSTYTRKKKSKGRLIDLSLLPRRTILHDLAENEKHCACCHHPLKRMGEDRSEKVEVLPKRLYVEEHIQYKYSCWRCERIYSAPKEKAPIPKALAGGSLLTEIIINKYQYHLPLYRQSKILASHQAIIPDNTLGNWVMQVGEGLMPVYEAFWEVVLVTARYLQVDETPIQILNPNKKGYLWSYFAPYLGQGLVIFELSLTRAGEVVEERLHRYEGLMQTDGYGGYNKLRGRDKIEGLGCLTHVRRKFDEVRKASKNPDGIAQEAINRLKPLYALEARMREAGYDFKIKKRLRQKIARPILKAFYHWLKQIKPQVLPRSQLGEAIQYALNQQPYVIKYLRHGMAEIDTNGVENKIRDIAIGKKNWLFMGNKEAGVIHALFYSLILSSILNNLNPRIYIHYLIMQIHDIRQGKADPKTLLPHTIDHKLLQDFATQQMDKATCLLNSS